MPSTKERACFEGILRGQGHEATCTVEATKVSLPGSNAVAYTGYRIDPRSVSMSLPDGIYTLSANGEQHQLRHQNGHWLAAFPG
jgi:hypothetical protein